MNSYGCHMESVWCCWLEFDETLGWASQIKPDTFKITLKCSAAVKQSVTFVTEVLFQGENIFIVVLFYGTNQIQVLLPWGQWMLVYSQMSKSPKLTVNILLWLLIHSYVLLEAMLL